MASLKLILASIVLIAVLLVSGCTQTSGPSGAATGVKCNDPYIRVGDDCCLDQNENDICDSDEGCPSSCDDGNECTTDYCSERTDYNCVHDILYPCCGNGICEETAKENTFTCKLDCHRSACKTDTECDDDNICTKDTCTKGFCYNVKIDAPCQFKPCNTDSECDDENGCTKDTCIGGTCYNNLISNCLPD